jgi:zinc D-Ala-D-Ala carboxypeptidase
LDGIAGVTTRMAQIEVRLAAITAGATPRMAAITATNSAASGTTFASVYAQAMSANGSTATSPSSLTAAAARLGANGVPVDLAAYGNGKVPANALRTVGTTGHKLWAPASSALESLMEAARRDGVKIGITDSYRPYAEQVDLARRKGLYSQGGLAAKPGTSDHGWGLAVDLDLNAKAQTWMRANAGSFGFVENTPREPWHWAFTPR